MPFLQKISKALDVLGSPVGRTALTGPKPRSIASAILCNQLKQECCDIRTVIDGGANIGQFARAAATAFPSAAIHSFEPAPDTVEIVRQNLAGLASVRIHQAALGREVGTAPFHRNSNSQTSSLLKIAEDKGVHSGIQSVDTVQVPVTTLDAFAAEQQLADPILLKLDLQGYELEALRGAPNLLKRVRYILVETVFDHLYEGEPLFHEIQAFLQGSGFRFVRPLAFLKEPTGRIVQMDALFQNLA